MWPWGFGRPAPPTPGAAPARSRVPPNNRIRSSRRRMSLTDSGFSALSTENAGRQNSDNWISLGFLAASAILATPRECACLKSAVISRQRVRGKPRLPGRENGPFSLEGPCDDPVSIRLQIAEWEPELCVAKLNSQWLRRIEFRLCVFGKHLRAGKMELTAPEMSRYLPESTRNNLCKDCEGASIPRAGRIRRWRPSPSPIKRFRKESRCGRE